MPKERKHGTTTPLPSNKSILREMGFLPEDPYPPAQLKTRATYGLSASQRTNVNNRLKHALDQEHGAFTSDYYRLLCRTPADRDLDSLRQAIHWAEQERERLGTEKAPMRHRDSTRWSSENEAARLDFEIRQEQANATGIPLPDHYPAPTKQIIDEVPVTAGDLKTVVSLLIKRRLDRNQVLAKEYPWQNGIGTVEQVQSRSTGGKSRKTLPKNESDKENDDPLPQDASPLEQRRSLSSEEGIWYAQNAAGAPPYTTIDDHNYPDFDPDATESDGQTSSAEQPSRKRRIDLPITEDTEDKPSSRPIKKARTRATRAPKVEAALPTLAPYAPLKSSMKRSLDYVDTATENEERSTKRVFKACRSPISSTSSLMPAIQTSSIGGLYASGVQKAYPTLDNPHTPIPVIPEDPQEHIVWGLYDTIATASASDPHDSPGQTPAGPSITVDAHGNPFYPEECLPTTSWHRDYPTQNAPFNPPLTSEQCVVSNQLVPFERPTAPVADQARESLVPFEHSADPAQYQAPEPYHPSEECQFQESYQGPVPHPGSTPHQSAEPYPATVPPPVPTLNTNYFAELRTPLPGSVVDVEPNEPIHTNLEPKTELKALNQSTETPEKEPDVTISKEEIDEFFDSAIFLNEGPEEEDNAAKAEKKAKDLMDPALSFDDATTLSTSHAQAAME